MMAVQVLYSGYRPSELMVVDEVVIKVGYLVRRSLLSVELISQRVKACFLVCRLLWN